MSVIHTRVCNDEIQSGGNRVARALDRAGVGQRGNVAVLLPNVVEFLWAYRGCAWSGRRCTPMSWRWSIDEATYVIENCEADIVIAHARFADIARSAAAALPAERRISVGGPIEGFVPFEEFVAGCSPDELDHPLAGDTMLYTSGTTGRPKGVLRPMAADMAPPSRVGRGGMMMLQTYLGGEPDRVHLVAAPLYHSGPVSYCEGAALLGADVVLMDGWDAAEFLHLIELHAVTSTFVVPIHFVRLLKLSDEQQARYDLSSLRLVVHGAAPTAIEVKRKMIEWFGPILYEFYGGTEGGGVSISSREWLRKPGSVGRPYNPAVELHILDDNGRPCPTGIEGAVYFRQPDAVTYKDDPEKTRDAHRGDLLTLCDVGYLDEDGFLYLCDRRADVIVSGGVNVYPAQIESVLLDHPAIADCCVVGAPDEEWGEAVRAVVQLRSGLVLDDAMTDDLRQWCRERLAGYQLPRAFDAVDELPRTETGKMARQVVRASFWSHRNRRI
ncbi:MAG: AMP-binding protein [Acidimicrobiales bacterium]